MGKTIAATRSYAGIQAIIGVRRVAVITRFRARMSKAIATNRRLTTPTHTIRAIIAVHPIAIITTLDPRLNIAIATYGYLTTPTYSIGTIIGVVFIPIITRLSICASHLSIPAIATRGRFIDCFHHNAKRIGIICHMGRARSSCFGDIIKKPNVGLRRNSHREGVYPVPCKLGGPLYCRALVL
jgi:hypothetical protein